MPLHLLLIDHVTAVGAAAPTNIGPERTTVRRLRDEARLSGVRSRTPLMFCRSNGEYAGRSTDDKESRATRELQRAPATGC